MAEQYIYNDIPNKNTYNQKEILYQYRPGSNPLDPLGLQGANYIIVDDSHNSIATQKINTFQSPGTATTYITKVEQPIYQVNAQQNNNALPRTGNNNFNAGHTHIQNVQHPGKEAYYQGASHLVHNQVKINQPIVQPQINQNINHQLYKQHNAQQNPQIYNQKNVQQEQVQIQQKINPQIQALPQQKYQYQNQQQKVQPQVIPQNHQQYHHQNIQPQMQPHIQTQKIINYSPTNAQIVQAQKNGNIPQANIQPNKQQNILPQKQPQMHNKQIVQNLNQTQQQVKAQGLNPGQIQLQQNQAHPQINQQQIKGQVMNPAQAHLQQNQVHPQINQQQVKGQVMNPDQVHHQQNQAQQHINQPQIKGQILKPGQINLQQNQAQPQVQFQGLNPPQIHYQQYIKNQNHNINQNKINIDYNKNDEHFVNKPIYQDKNPVHPTKASQTPLNIPKTLDDTKKKSQREKTLETNTVNNNGKVGLNNKIDPKDIIAAKYMNSGLSSINEEELNINQSGLSKKISMLNTSKNEEEKESPIEEKKPEEAFPVDIIEEKNIENNTQNPITESGISDIDSKLDHLPTINSIMKGNSEPLPPTKKKKYGK